MRRYISKKIKDKSGQDMVEFTFVLPLLMFCFGRYSLINSLENFGLYSV